MAAVFAALLTAAIAAARRTSTRSPTPPTPTTCRGRSGTSCRCSSCSSTSPARSSSSPRRSCRAGHRRRCSRCRSSTAARQRHPWAPAPARVHSGVRRRRPGPRHAHLARPARRADALRSERLGAAVAGRYLLTEGPDATCARCHVEGGPGSPVRDTRISRDDDWLLFHMADPVAIAPGARPARPAFAPVLDDDQARAVLAYLRRLRAGAAPPQSTPASAGPLQILGTRCVACHTHRRRRRHHRPGPEPRRRPARRRGHPPDHHRPERRVRRFDDADLRHAARAPRRSRRWPPTWRRGSRAELQPPEAAQRRASGSRGAPAPWLAASCPGGRCSR